MATVDIRSAEPGAARARDESSGSERVLVVEGLCREFDTRRVVDNFNLSLSAGERVALRGRNGSGKTTILRCILGTLTPTRGRISVGGHAAGSLAARSLLGAVLPQDRAFYLRLTGRTNLLFFAKIRGLDRREAGRKVQELDAELRLAETLSRRLDRCSSGMLQKLAIARGLIAEPPLLLLDEPTRSLDDAAVELLWAALERRPELAVLIATHRRDDVARCNRAIQLSRS
jgi:ABC-type multidrug transport system ATPase subunit